MNAFDYLEAAVVCNAKAIFLSMFANGASIQQVQQKAAELQQAIVSSLQASALESTTKGGMHQQMEPQPPEPNSENPFT